MSSGSAPKARPAADTYRSVPNSYIVTLHRTLTEDQRKAHMQAAFRACNAKTIPGTRDPACITRVYRYPRNSPNPEFYVYVGKFGQDVAEAIKARTQEVESIRLEAMGTLCNLQFDARKTPSWGLSAISHGPDNKEIGAPKPAALKDLIQANQYTYNSIKVSKDRNATIFVLDSGYEYTAHKDGPGGLKQHFQDRIDCYDMSMLALLNTGKKLNDLAVNGIPQDEIQEIMASHKTVIAKAKLESEDKDRTQFHGTNVALTASSSVWGAGAAASVISYGVCEMVKSDNGTMEPCPTETGLLDALSHMQSRPELLKNSVVNCSWSLRMIPKGANPDGQEAKARVLAWSMMKDIEDAGSHLVVAAGNDNLPLVDYQEWKDAGSPPGMPASYIPFDLILPLNVGKITTVGATGRDCRKANFSNFPHSKRHPIPFIWAPGVNLPGWLPDGKFQELFGTSFAAPIVSGVVASIIMARDSDAPLKRPGILSTLSQMLCVRDETHAEFHVHRLEWSN